MDGPKDCHIVFSHKQEKKLYINAHLYNLEKWHSWYLQSRNKDTGAEDKGVDTKRER